MKNLRSCQRFQSWCIRLVIICLVAFNLQPISSVRASAEATDVLPQIPVSANVPTSTTESILSVVQTNRSSSDLADLATSPHCGTLQNSETWSGGGTVHLVTCNVIVPFGKTLAITQGAIVKFNLNYRLTVNGKLLVQGTGAAPVIITSYRDDDHGGDTNQDGASVCSAGDWDGIFFGDTSDDTSLVEHALVRCVGDGYYGRAAINFDNASPIVQDTEFRQSQYCGLRADLHSFPTLSGNTYTSNGGNGLCLLPEAAETIDTNATWSQTDTTYYLRGNITLVQGRTLTLSPGIVIKIGLNYRLTINGKLLVQGSGQAPVTITSYRDDDYGRGSNWDTDGGGASVCSPGDWDGIFFTEISDDTSLVDHVLIRCSGDGYYGRAAINFDNASPTVQNSEFRQDAYCGVQGDLHSFPKLVGNTYTNNAANGFCLLPQSGETIDTNTTWGPIDTSYYLRGNVPVVLGRTLTLAPGIVVKVGLNYRLTINGKLLVQGTELSPVVITSYRDDDHGIGNNRDTNGGGDSDCSGDDWDGIFFTDTSDDTSLVDHALIRCAGDSYYVRAAVNLDHASPHIQNSTLTKNSFGIVTDTSSPVLGCNNLLTNSRYGIYNKTPNTLVSAENQWWGDPSGPYHANLNSTGKGNAVSNGVGFMPYRTTPCGIPTTTYTLTVNKTGTGSGTVISNPPGINCGLDCSEVFASNTTVTLTATPNVGSTFTGWSGGGCSDTGACNVVVTADTTVTANFNTQLFTLTVNKTGNGTGTVTSNPAGINCGSDCSEQYAYNTSVTLTATPAPGSAFSGWSGACLGPNPCKVDVTAAKTVTATFTITSTNFMLTVNKTGTGSGMVTGPGINCGADCSELYPVNTMVKLTATPATDSIFDGWSGACSGTDSCTITMTSNRSVTANFVLKDADTTGVFRPSNGALYLKNMNRTGFADIAINYGQGGDYPVVGDWDGDGTVTIGIYRNGLFYLRNSNTIGFADWVLAFGAPGDQPIAGDWDGDGVDTIGVYRSSTGAFYLRNENSSGAPDMSFSLGIPGDVGIAGDWNGDGIVTTGVFRPSNGALYLKNINDTGIADIQINYGLPGDQPVTGDWNNDGIDTIGVYRNGTFYLRNTNIIGFADIVFDLGIPGDMPIAGNWDALP